MVNRGDRVTVVMSRNDVFPWQDGPKWEATLTHKPQGPGDTFNLVVEQPQREFATDISEYVGCKVALNGNSRDFVGIYRADTTPTEGETPNG